ncbi:hypothetical protein BD410DRAFT_1487 [Rickenella mellea]|uniref:MYND-type domain-containing protein n=1 Tax=Rickenella mellea TaxID=50990 RepID=A0A4R5XEQ0_9AGAM|nr:hypothetical protein BD410DRAFT_1487 [Rickenella mellea]
MSSINCVNPICGNRDRVESAVFMKCGACKKVAYCGKACQKSHWKFHKLYCKSIRDAPQVPDMDEIGRRMDELNEALFGNHAPASRRITFRSFGDGSPDSPRAKKFADGLDVGDVMQYGIEKFLETTDKGCVVFNMRYPYMDTKSYSRLTWLSRRGVASTGEPTLLKNVTQ